MADQQHQTSKLAGRITEFQHCFGAMSSEDRQWAIENPEEAIGLFASAVKNRTSEATPTLLTFLRPISLPAIPKFVAAEKYREGETVDGIKVGWLGGNFETHFLQKVEGPVPALNLREYELVKPSRDSAIITELGGEEKVETTLGQFWEFLKTADRTLWHIRHIRDMSGILWAVSGNWDGGGLNVEAVPLDSPDGWGDGGWFVSR